MERTIVNSVFWAVVYGGGINGIVGFFHISLLFTCTTILFLFLIIKFQPYLVQNGDETLLRIRPFLRPVSISSIQSKQHLEQMVFDTQAGHTKLWQSMTCNVDK